MVTSYWPSLLHIFVSVNEYNLASRVVEIISYLHHLSCHLSRLAINGLYLFFKDSLSLNKSVVVVGLIYIYICIVICMYCMSDHVRTAYLFFSEDRISFEIIR